MLVFRVSLKTSKGNKLKIHDTASISALMDLALERRCQEIRMREIKMSSDEIFKTRRWR